jgi:L-alanine-DL-glutamate epimerase-like enolase superfamily enzyme
MRIERLEAEPVRVRYTHAEVSSLVARDGVTDVIVKVIADDGMVGWGECTRAADAAGIACAVAAMAPIVVGRDPWDSEAIAHDVYLAGAWQFQAMTGSFAFAGIDMALWDLCGKACGQPLPGLGVEVDPAKLARYHQEYVRHGEFAPYGNRFGNAE